MQGSGPCSVFLPRGNADSESGLMEETLTLNGGGVGSFCSLYRFRGAYRAQVF